MPKITDYITVRRSVYISISVGILLTIPLVIYQNFLVPADLERPNISTEKIQVLSPLNDQVISLFEAQILIWLESQQSYPAIVRITNKWGTTLAEKSIQVDLGESEHFVDINETLRSFRDGWLHLELLANGEIVARQRFALGLIFLTAGGKNSANFQCAKCEERPPHKYVRFLEDVTAPGDADLLTSTEWNFVPATVRSPLASGEAKSVWYYLGERIWQKSRIPVAFINIGQGQSTISDWLNKNSSGFEYGKHFNLTAVLWHHGEADLQSTSREEYRSNLLELVEQTRREFEYEVPWFISRASHCENSSKNNEEEIVAAQNDVITGMGLTDVYAGPNTNTIKHSCSFDTQEELNAYADSWYFELKNSSLLGKLLK